MHKILLLALAFLSASTLLAQKVLQIETRGRVKTQKLFIGDEIRYRVVGDDLWHTGYISDLLIEKNVIALEDRYLKLEEIEAMRWYRGWTKPVSISLYTFGLAWSGFALIGTVTDGDPETNYRWSDAIVTAVSVAAGWIVQKFFRWRTVRFGNRKRLRMLDLSFKNPGSYQP